MSTRYRTNGAELTGNRDEMAGAGEITHDRRGQDSKERRPELLDSEIDANRAIRDENRQFGTIEAIRDENRGTIDRADQRPDWRSDWRSD